MPDTENFGARYYSTNSARFMSPDPVDMNPENPSSFNRYAYGNNNPYKYVDPDGNNPFVVGFIVGGILGALDSWHNGERGLNLLRSGVIGGIVGGISTFGGTVPSSILYGGIAGAGGSMVAQGLNKGFDNVNKIDTIANGTIGAVSNGLGLGIATRIIPKLNLPYHPGFHTNYIQPTVRAIWHAPSEVRDSATRSMYSIGYSNAIGLNSFNLYSIGKNYINNNLDYKNDYLCVKD